MSDENEQVPQQSNRQPLSREGWLWITAIATVLAVGFLLTLCFWGQLRDGEDSLSTIVSNVGIVIGGVVAILLAMWRSRVAERQSIAAQHQAEIIQSQVAIAQDQINIAQRQADTAQQGLLNERYQKGAEMLGSNALTLRLGGIFALQRLAEEHPEQYHVQITRLFCAFVRPAEIPSEPPDMIPEPNPVPPTADIQAIMDAIGAREEHRQMLEDQEKYRLWLSLVKLSAASLGRANLSSAQMDWAWLDRADLRETNLSGATVDNSALDYAWLGGAKLVGTSFRSAGLQGASFWGLTGPIRTLPTYADAVWDEGLLTADLTGAHLNSSNMSIAQLQGSDLSRANLTYTVLRGADLSDTNLFGAVFARANLSGTKFSDNGERPARGLTQYQLDEAWADLDNPPYLEGVVDASTGEPLEWRNR